jgi:SM-20-related protein
LVAAKHLAGTGDESTTDETLFARIAQDLQAQGYSICPMALPLTLANTLYHHQQTMDAEKYSSEGIDRGQNYLTNGFISGAMKFAG